MTERLSSRCAGRSPADAPALPCLPPGPRGARVSAAASCVFLGAAACPLGSSGAGSVPEPSREPGSEGLRSGCSALRLHPVSPPPAQRRFRQQPRSGVVLSGAVAGRGASLLAAGEVKALGFPVWEFGCVAVRSATGPPARRPGRAVPVHPAAGSSGRARYPCAHSPQRAAAAASPVSTQLHDGRRAPTS